MATAKHQLDLVPADALMQATDATSPVIATAAVRLMARLSDRVNLPVNVVVSNVPGPREPLYFAGAKLDHYIPVSTISNGVGLNITVHSYEDRLDFGLVADRDLVPDLWELVDLHVDEIATLFEATGAEWAVPPRPAAKRGRRAKPQERDSSTPHDAPEPRRQTTADEPSAQQPQTTAEGKSGAKNKTKARKKAAAKKKSAAQKSKAT